MWDRRLPSNFTTFWDTNPDGTGTNFLVDTRVWNSHTIYAQWVERQETFNITFVNNRPFLGSGTFATHTPIVNYLSGQTMRERGQVFPTGGNWTDFTNSALVGWNTEPDGSGFPFDRDTPVTENIRVYAQWTAFVYFHPNDFAPHDTIPEEHRYRMIQIGIGIGQAPFLSPCGTASGIPPYSTAAASWWPGHYLLGWNMHPRPFDAPTGADTRWVGPTTQFTYPRRVYAIWQAVVTFDGHGGSFSAASDIHNDFPPGSITADRIRQLQNDIGLGYMPFALTRPGWRPATVEGFPNEYYWHTYRFAVREGRTGPFLSHDPDNGGPFRHNTLVIGGKTVYAQWLTELYFTAPDFNATIDGLPIGTNVMHTMPETGTVANNVPGGIPIAHRPGHTFVTWRVEVWCSTTNDYIWVDFDENFIIGDGLHGAAGTGLVPGDDNRFRRNTEGRIVIEAIFEVARITFPFYKTNMTLYPEDGSDPDPDDLEYLQGALFHLYRLDDISNEWEHIALGTSNADGRVNLFPNIFIGEGHHLTGTGQYMLREIVAPEGYAPPGPAGHWIIEICQINNIISDIIGFNGVLPFVLVSIPTTQIVEGVEVTTYEDFWHVGNMPGILFPFQKMDNAVYQNNNWQTVVNNYLLEGAQFRLFRTNVPTADLITPLGTGNAGLVTWTSSGPNYPWVDLGIVTSTGLASDPIIFGITRGFTYQLVEIAAPAGFQVSLGQWRIVIDDSIAGNFSVYTIGSVPSPDFVHVPCDCNDINCDDPGMWYICNWQMFTLPGPAALVGLFMWLPVVLL